VSFCSPFSHSAPIMSYTSNLLLLHISAIRDSGSCIINSGMLAENKETMYLSFALFVEYVDWDDEVSSEMSAILNIVFSSN
jgi:hypothetical protein